MTIEHNKDSDFTPYELSFGTYYDLGNSILEGIVDEGVEMGVAEVQQIIDVVNSIDPPPKALLANRKFHYSFSFSVMRMIAGKDTFKAVAVVNYGRSAKMEAISDLLWPKFFKLRFFSDREKALR